MPNAVITGASRGLGRALAGALLERGWSVTVDARNGAGLTQAVEELGSPERITSIAGDVGDAAHRRAIRDAVERAGSLELLVNNASVLGASPLPALERYPLRDLERVLRINTVAPLGLIQELLPPLGASGGTIINVTSDAALEAYQGWGGYGASKSALEQISAVLAAERPDLRVYSFDPGDMRTLMHQEAFPGEDISDRPLPQSVVPSLLQLIDRRPPSGRYTSAELAAPAEAIS